MKLGAVEKGPTRPLPYRAIEVAPVDFPTAVCCSLNMSRSLRPSLLDYQVERRI